MSTETMAATVAHHDEAHPNRDATYVKVALILAAITGLETFTYFSSVYPKSWERAVMPVLMVCMATKFYLIGAYFMHLKWDKPVLRRAFMTGITIALIVYIVMLTTFKFWNNTHYMPH